MVIGYVPNGAHHAIDTGSKLPSGLLMIWTQGENSNDQNPQHSCFEAKQPI
jgi:hypothetical protein